MDEAPESGFKVDQVKINKKYGGGFPANVEGLHHLHCLVSESDILLELVSNLNRTSCGKHFTITMIIIVPKAPGLS